MQFWFSDQARLLWLIILCGLLWSLESVIPLYRFQLGRWRHAAPNLALTVLLILTNVTLSLGTAYLAAFAAQRGVGLLPWLGLAPWVALVLGVAGMDCFTYLAHVLLHKTQLGWCFHRVHHSDSEVDVTTAFRQHPGETIWRILWQLAAIVVFGVPLWVAAVYLTVSALNAQLEHANIKVPDQPDRWLRLVIVTPNMHKAHHSRAQCETDSNYSNIFSGWDRLGGTYTAAIDLAQFRYGLDGFDGDDQQSLAGLLRLPFLREKKDAC
jgi:sterol desaturase/sphingolipid hydroxylase (fatty acid hydroxylase superfamily)